MPIVIKENRSLYEKLIDIGVDVITENCAARQDIREIHIGILNLMPDAALKSTERQFIKLIASCNKIIQIRIHLFTLNEIIRAGEILHYISETYETFDQIKKDGLDALIITGAPPIKENISDEKYNNSLTEVVDWALDNVTSTWASCLSAQFVAYKYYSVHRNKLNEKLWGVFPHTVKNTSHPLVSNLNTRFNCIHSRFYDIDSKKLEQQGFISVIECELNQQFLLASSSDGIRMLLCQGHPEYDTISLFKEYKREVSLYLSGQRPKYPPLPEGYFEKETERLLNEYRAKILSNNSNNYSADFLDEIVGDDVIFNTWIDTSKALFSNWLGLIYRITGFIRSEPFAEGVNLGHPLDYL